MRRVRVTRLCDECSAAFETKPSVVQRFCGRRCYQAWNARTRAAAAATKGCAVDGCSKPHLAKGFCTMHYQRQAHGGPLGSAGPASRSGAHNANWRGGRIRGGGDLAYWVVQVPEHPNANSLGYILEHRLVAEQMLGRPLAADEVVHHINHDKLDNRPENLAVMTQSEHVRVHAADAREGASR